MSKLALILFFKQILIQVIIKTIENYKNYIFNQKFDILLLIYFIRFDFMLVASNPPIYLPLIVGNAFG